MEEDLGFFRVKKKNDSFFIKVAFLLILKIPLIIVLLIHHGITFGGATD
jgi:hypothetical protein